MIKNLLFGLMILISVSSCSNNEKQVPKAVKGVIDLRNWNFEKDGSVYINGEWYFYYNGFLNYNDFDTINHKELMNIPATGNYYYWKNQKVSSKSYYSFYLKLILPKNDKFSLRLKPIRTAYKLFINDRLYDSAGILGKDKEHGKPEYKSEIIDINNHNSDTVNLVIWISNYHYWKGGILNSILLGKTKKIYSLQTIYILRDSFIVGGLIALLIFFTFTYFFMRHQNLYLQYSLWCLAFILRVISVDEIIILNVIPQLNWELLVKFELISQIMISVLGMYYWNNLVKNKFSKLFMTIALPVGIILSIIITFTPASFHSELLPLNKYYSIICATYYLILCIIMVIQQKDNAYLMFFGYSFMYLGGINEVFSTMGIRILDGEYFNYLHGAFIFFIFLAIIMSKQFSKSFKDNEELTKELRKNKDELEIKVQERTKELHKEKEKTEELLLKSDKLLLNVLPQQIAERLKSGETQIADHFEEASVIFIDIADFTKMSTKSSPQKMVNMLNDIFSIFDKISAKYGIEKIKTIGDCYMAAAGIPVPREDHAQAIAMMALEVMETMKGYSYSSDDFKLSDESIKINFRIGLDCGPIVAGVIGEQKFIYDLWGDMVNTASRMESNGVTGKIQCTERFKEKVEKIPLIPPFSKGESAAGGFNPFLKGESTSGGFIPFSNSEDSAEGILQVSKREGNELHSLEKGGQGGFFFEERGEIEIKGKGLMKTYFLVNSQ